METLDIKQLLILEDFINGKNIFMSGPAGTGKTFLIKFIKNICKQTHKNCQVTALTGCAALLLDCDAKTIHSWSGIGAANSDDVNYYLKKLKKNNKYLLWKEINVLIIDEISMLSKKFFNLLDSLGKKIRGNDLPFGGIQLVFSGDFFQLPPVSKDNDDSALFCFESELWEQTFSKIHVLTKIFRQDNKIFSKMLNNIRVGKLTKSTFELLKSRVIPFENKENIIPTKILPYRKTVQQINEREHNLLPDNNNKIYGVDILSPSDEDIEKYDISNKYLQNTKNVIIDNNPNIEIKIGDQVICNYNISDKIVNGSRGVVVKIEDYPIVKFVSGITTKIKPVEIYNENIKGLVYKKLPLDYAWALTIHKCQGMTLDLCIMDIGSNIFADGQTYVALSRVKNIEGLYLLSFDPYKITSNKKVVEFYDKHTEQITFTKDERISEKKRIIQLISDFIEANKEIVRPVVNDKLLDSLKEFRLEKSKKNSIPAYCVLTNETLNLISTNIPNNISELSDIKGIGKNKLALYGGEIISIIEQGNHQ